MDQPNKEVVMGADIAKLVTAILWFVAGAVWWKATVAAAESGVHGWSAILGGFVMVALSFSLGAIFVLLLLGVL